MLARCIIGSLLLIYIACKSKPDRDTDRLIVNSHLILDSTPPVVEFIFEMPIYMDMDGRMIEHGTMPVKMKNVVFNHVRLEGRKAGVDTIIYTYVTAPHDSLLLYKKYTISAEDMQGALYEKEIYVNTKRYLVKQK